MQMFTVTLIVVFWWCSVTITISWNVSRLYGTPLRARLTDVAVWRNRAYACWPRLDASQPVTLLELPWPETAAEEYAQLPPSSSSATLLHWKPRRPFYADQQIIGDCRHVQSAVGLDLDKIRGHLYVLDSGYNCQPKIIIYDLKTYKCIQLTEFGGLNGLELATLVVDARPFKGETRVYVGNVRGGYLVVYDPNQSVWYKVTLNRPKDLEEIDVPAECITVSKFQSSVFMTSTRSHNLYSASFRDLRNLTSYVMPSIKNGDVFPIELRVRWEGLKLGSSRGLYADIQGGLNYVYTRDYVAIRLDPAPGGLLAAAIEDQKVLMQSYDLLPAVTKIFTDNANYLQVWAMNAVPNAENRHSVKINKL